MQHTENIFTTPRIQKETKAPPLVLYLGIEAIKSFIFKHFFIHYNIFNIK